MSRHISTWGVAEAATSEPYVERAVDRLGMEFESTREGFGIDPVFALGLAVMYPVIRFVLVNIGLPWLYEAARYSELWRLRIDRWITEQYTFQWDLDPHD